MWARWLNVLFGIWLMAAPWVLGYTSNAARQSSFWTGLAVALVALVAMRYDATRFLNALLGVWLIVVPFILGYATRTAEVNSILFGVLVLLVSLVPTSHRIERLPTGRPVPTT